MASIDPNQPHVRMEETEPVDLAQIKTKQDSKISFESAEPAVYHPLNSSAKGWVIDVVFMTIPALGLVYEQWLGHCNIKQVPNKVDKIDFVESVVEDRNSIKKYSLIAHGINAAIFGAVTVFFPFIGAIALTTYTCFFIKNLVQMNANWNVIKSLKEGTMILPVGPDKEVPEGKKEFSSNEIE